MALSEFKKRAKSHIPETYTALESTNKFGEELIDVHVNSVKEDIFGSAITEGAEAGYPPIVKTYCGLRIAIDLIGPGIEYWMNQASSFSASGQNETKMYTDRAEVLRKHRDLLVAKAKEVEGPATTILGDSANFKTRRKVLAVGEADNELMVTPNPFGFERPFAQPNVEEF